MSNIVHILMSNARENSRYGRMIQRLWIVDVPGKPFARNFPLRLPGCLFPSLNELALGRLSGLPALGVYVRAANLSNMIWDNVYGSLTRVAFTQLAEDNRQGKPLGDTFLRTLQLVTGFLWPALCGIAVLSQPLVHILYGAKWHPAAAPLSCLMISQAISLSYGLNWELFVINNETGRQVRIRIDLHAGEATATVLTTDLTHAYVHENSAYST